MRGEKKEYFSRQSETTGSLSTYHDWR